jgi:hypothetical protein
MHLESILYRQASRMFEYSRFDILEHTGALKYSYIRLQLALHRRYNDRPGTRPHNAGRRATVS